MKRLWFLHLGLFCFFSFCAGCRASFILMEQWSSYNSRCTKPGCYCTSHLSRYRDKHTWPLESGGSQSNFEYQEIAHGTQPGPLWEMQTQLRGRWNKKENDARKAGVDVAAARCPCIQKHATHYDTSLGLTKLMEVWIIFPQSSLKEVLIFYIYPMKMLKKMTHFFIYRLFYP